MPVHRIDRWEDHLVVLSATPEQIEEFLLRIHQRNYENRPTLGLGVTAIGVFSGESHYDGFSSGPYGPRVQYDDLADPFEDLDAEGWVKPSRDAPLIARYTPTHAANTTYSSSETSQQLEVRYGGTLAVQGSLEIPGHETFVEQLTVGDGFDQRDLHLVMRREGGSASFVSKVLRLDRKDKSTTNPENARIAPIDHSD